VRQPTADEPRERLTETVCAITSLTAAQARPAGLARIMRGHWGIENCSAECTYE
jgi:hypothetical protein